jgi:hypothetical protein
MINLQVIRSRAKARMTRDLLEQMQANGFSLTRSADGKKLLVRPWSKLPEDMREALREALREAKPELLALLAVRDLVGQFEKGSL